jgi:hypothetical protein
MSIVAGFWLTLHFLAHSGMIRMMQRNCTSEPWMHVTYFTIGCIVGNWVPKYEKRLVEDINAIRASKGMPPMVGTHAWLKYDMSDTASMDKRKQF